MHNYNYSRYTTPPSVWIDLVFFLGKQHVQCAINSITQYTAVFYEEWIDYEVYK